jgi:hypothetical protein
MTVVVEVDERLAPLRRPLSDPLGPPPQIVVGVGPGVEVMLIRAVGPHVPGGLFKRAMWSCISGSSAHRRPAIPRSRLAFPMWAL